MAVVIRLRQEGQKGRPVFRIVAADQRFPKEGRFLEILGTYDPQQGVKKAIVKMDRVNAWISQGAKPTDTVKSLIKHAAAAVSA
ncbi:30S ribosomal protein S16 [Prosthecobacter sp.]|uniref:30S ribosomal protein S16 n=1 Tax=Prosthecobacter sp. TaxID=1965333 RepID=UPI003783754E